MSGPDDVEFGGFDSTVRERIQLQDVPRPQRPHLLEQVRGVGSPREILLDADRATVGRGAGCDIALDSAGVSRQHLMLARRGPEYWCQDCDSSNGVYLNGVRIQSAVLREGDRLQIGDVVFVYHEGA